MEAQWFGRRLIELRTEKGLSRDALAQAAGFRSRHGIVALEHGRRLPSWETVIALCKALGVDPSAFAKRPKPAPIKLPVGRPRKTED